MIDSSLYVDNIIAWFQNKVADYDLQIWEKSVVRRELQEELTVEGSRKAPVPEHLIDLDLVQGNTFAKAKPIESGWRPWMQGISRAIFMPVHVQWWQERTSTGFTVFLILLWAINAVTLSSFVALRQEEHSVPILEILIPMISTTMLSILHCHICQTQAHEFQHFTKHQRRQRREQHTTLRRSSMFSDIGPFAGIRARLYSKHSDTQTSDTDNLEDLRSSENIIRENQVIRNRTLRRSSEDDRPHVSDVGPSESNGPRSPEITEKRKSSKTSNRRNAERKSSRLDNIYDNIKNESSSSTSGSSSENSDSELISDAPDAVKAGPERIHVRLWEENHWVKASVSLVDLGALIMRKVFQQKQSSFYFYIGLLFAVLNACLPSANRIYNSYKRLNPRPPIPELVQVADWRSVVSGGAPILVVNTLISRFFVSAMCYFLLSIALRVYRQRLLAAKHFSHITSARRARKSDLPHFRLNKVRNIKLWLSLRSYIRRRGAQRSVDIIVSSSFILVLLMLVVIAISLIHGNVFDDSSPVLWEVTFNSVTCGFFVMQILTQGSKINKRYLNSSVLLTEQINLYLRMERKPHKKEALSRANAVLGLAVKLIKEIESPFKVYGLVMSPWLYNVTRMVILSAFSGVVSEILGFKLKLWKIKTG